MTALRALRGLGILLCVFLIIPVAYCQSGQGLFWNLDIEEGFIMYELEFRRSRETESTQRVNVSFTDTQPDIPVSIDEWSHIPDYPSRMVMTNGTELDDLEEFIPGFCHLVMPIGNWSLLGSLIRELHNGSDYFEVDDHDEESWGYFYRWEPENTSYRYSHSFTYYIDSGLLFTASFWVSDKYEGGSPLRSVHFHIDHTYNSPLPTIYTVYLIVSITSLAVVMIFVWKTDRL